MKFKDIIQNHLLTEGRTKEVSIREALDFYETNCSITHSGIYRGLVSYSKFNYGIVEPKGKGRASANTSNYYTLVMDNESKWNRFPNRSDSIVCSTSKQKASTYGPVYRVYPVREYKIGVCPSRDIWSSFKNINKILGMTGPVSANSLGEFNYGIKNLAKAAGSRLGERPSFNEFKHTLDNIYIDNIEEPRLDEYNLSAKNIIEAWGGPSSSTNTSLYEFVVHILDPNKNNFKTKTTSSELLDLNDREVWTSAPSLLVKNKIHDRFIEEVIG